MTEALPERHPVLQGVEYMVGTWAWGDRYLWGYGQEYGRPEIEATFEMCCENGTVFFDTAEVYGQGKSEQLLGEFIKEIPCNFRIATKFMPYPWRLGRGFLLRALKASLKRLGVERVDLYQIHQPMPPLQPEVWMDGLVEALHAGWISAAGVSNYSRAWMDRAQNALIRSGFRLAANQVEYSLLNREIEKNGLLQHCQQQGITVLAYSPLAMGVLTGKYSPEKPVRGIRSAMYSQRTLARIKPLIQLLYKIGSDHAGKTAAQVALNWVICKGAVPIAGAKTPGQQQQNTGALGWRLTEDEVARLDQVSDQVAKEK
ncbi:predicted oxidoreductase [Longilinea arvoryzae]|uniref:Predicted oxidoreductase n=1 Tax=Longilinea arvoryzae TaxID=360412 RepID=A0A0S7BB98_9CHLR|nr:aldo/keto reductase [Longilinea arvoryzae]GAP15039.1 predicted oxidoreductase [Longilinea arvoryzae]